MKVTIIIVSYNEVNYICQAIDSCLSQSFKDAYEIIIGDDGSDDGSIEILKKYKQNYPEILRYFIMDRSNTKDIIPSIRVSNIIKQALSIANGKYIMCLSGDDYICTNNKLSSQAYFLDQEQNSKYAACFSGYKLVWDDGTEKALDLKGEPRQIFWSGTYAHISCFLFRKTVFDEGFLLDRFCDDTGLIYSIANAGLWHFEPEVMFAYRQREKSIMHEADKLELNILELLLLQDILPKRKMYFSSLARFARPIKYVFHQRKRLSESKYLKYIIYSQKYAHDYLMMIQMYEQAHFIIKLKVLILLSKSNVSYLLFKVFKKSLHLFRKIVQSG